MFKPFDDIIKYSQFLSGEFLTIIHLDFPVFEQSTIIAPINSFRKGDFGLNLGDLEDTKLKKVALKHISSFNFI